MEDTSTKPMASQPSPLTYEETPIIEPLPPEAPPEVSREPLTPSIGIQNPPATSAGIPQIPRRHRRSWFAGFLGQLVFFAILFVTGLYLSSQLRVMIPNLPQLPIPDLTTYVHIPAVFNRSVVPHTTPQVTPDRGNEITPSSEPSQTPMLEPSLSTYPVINGSTRSPIGVLSYQLPVSIAAPLCDGPRCPSMGTNLPGKTRFTVAARGKDQELPDFRGAKLTDANGREFDMKEIPLSGVTVTEYVGDFVGKTGGGFTFTKMRGILVPVNDALSVEFNHFSPEGVQTDWVADDQLINQVVASFAASLTPR